MKKETVEKQITTFEGDDIVRFGTKKEVAKFGNAGHIIVPRQLVGKTVEVYYLRLKK